MTKGRRALGFLGELGRLYIEKRVSRSAAQLSYFLTLSFFPLLICVSAVLGLLRLDETVIISSLTGLLPREVIGVIADFVDYVSGNYSTAMLTGGLILLATTLSAVFRAIISVMGDMHERPRYRGLGGFVASLVCALAFLLAVVLSGVIVVTGSWFLALIEKHTPLGQFANLWQWLRFVLLYFLMLGIIFSIYRFVGPESGERPPQLLGALLSALAMVVVSIVFSWFIGLTTRYSLVYGSLASVIILMIWLYIVSTVLIMGEMVNVVRSR